MPKIIDDQNLLLKVLHLTGHILIAIGTPPLCGIKILIQALIFVGQISLRIANFFFRFCLTVAGTLIQGGEAGKTWGADLLLGFYRERTAELEEVWKRFWHRQWSRPKIQLKFPHIEPVPYFPRKRDIVIAGISVGVFMLLVVIPLSLFIFFSTLPDPRLLAVREVPLTTKIYDRNGILLYQFYVNENRSLVTLGELPAYLPKATIAIEDQNFYSHQGFDLSAIARAAYADALGTSMQGGSTITQQLIKTTLLTPERTLSRKIKELALSFWTEKVYTKDQILTMYLNQVPYGGATYGVEAAAEIYFGKHAKDLRLGEAALLAGLPSAPSAYSPFGSHPELARDRQRQVLAAMVRDHYITLAEAEMAGTEKLNLAPIESSIKAPHFVMYVRDHLAKTYGIRTVEQGGLSVVTSLDYSLYEKVLETLQEGVEKQKYLNVGNGAVLVTNPKTGEILAMVGSTDFFDSAHDGNVNVTIRPRSPGSSIKPLNYALAFERGLLTASTILDDSPITYRVASQPPYSPGNYDGRFHGKVTVRVALGSSYNVPAVKVLEKNGVNNFIDFAKTTGITTFDDEDRFGLSLTLGGGEVLMTDMATAYSVFADLGMKTELQPILTVRDYKGEIIEDNTHRIESSRVVSPQTSFIISSILSDDSARAPTFGAGSYLNIPGHTVAVKTGTTETKRDNWTIGYSFGDDPRLVAVWVGNNDNSPMSPALESGNTGAAAIWHPIMQDLLKDKPNTPLTKPDNIIGVEVCAIGGKLPCDNCPFKRTEYFIRGTGPKEACTFTKEEIDKILHPDKPAG